MDSTARTGCIAAIVVGFLAAAVGVVVVIAGSGKPAATGAQAQQQAAGKAESTRSDDGPYPECGVILAWLRENSGDPKTLEIVKWEGRELQTAKGYEGVTVITVKYRGKNQYGGMMVERRFFNFKSGKLTNSTLSNNLN